MGIAIGFVFLILFVGGPGPRGPRWPPRKKKRKTKPTAIAIPMRPCQFRLVLFCVFFPKSSASSSSAQSRVLRKWLSYNFDQKGLSPNWRKIPLLKTSLLRKRVEQNMLRETARICSTLSSFKQFRAARFCRNLLEQFSQKASLQKSRAPQNG